MWPWRHVAVFQTSKSQTNRQVLEVAALPIQIIAYVQQIVAEAPVPGSVIRRRLARGVVAVGLGLVLVRRRLLLPLVPFLAHLCITTKERSPAKRCVSTWDR